MKHGALWRAVRELHENLNFTQKFCEEAFGLAGAHCSKNTWSRELTAAEAGDWKVSISKQFRAACRHVMQNSKTAWFRKIFTETATSEARAKTASMSQVWNWSVSYPVPDRFCGQYTADQF